MPSIVGVGWVLVSSIVEMGSAAIATVLAKGVDLKLSKSILGESFDPVLFDANAVNGKIPTEICLQLIQEAKLYIHSSDGRRKSNFKFCHFN